jgi:hypothetical protein
MAERKYTQEEIDAEVAMMEANWETIKDWTGAELQPDGSYHKRHPHGMVTLRLAVAIAEADEKKQAERERDEEWKRAQEARKGAKP